MFCISCGARRGEGAGFCHECGHRFSISSAESSPERPFYPARSDPEAVESRRRATGSDEAPRISRTVLVVALVAGVVLLLGGGTAGGVVLMTRDQHRSASVPRATMPVTPPNPGPVTVTVTPTAAPSPTPTPTPSPAPTERSFADLYKRVASGVVRIETTACDGGGVGSGFLIAPNLVATVAHVVSGSVSIAVRDGSTTATGTVVGYDADRELALVRTSSPLPGHVFTLDASTPDVGTDIAAIGYPLGGDESLTKGAVSGLGRRINVEGHHLNNLIQTDTSINPGNSGGPLLAVDGTVVGLVEAKRTDAENIGYAIPGSLATAQLLGWRAAPTAVHWSSGCDAPTGPDGVPVDITDRSGHPDGPAIAKVFSTYVDGINTGDYASAYQMLSPAAQRRTGYDVFSSGNVSSYIVQLSVDAITSDGPADTVEVRFTSVQDPTLGAHGQSCSDWSMTYRMVPSADAWLIDTASPHPGSPATC